MNRTVQFFSDEYLEQCRNMKPEQILVFLDEFQKLHFGNAILKSPSKLISMKVPEAFLEAFRLKCENDGVAYQTQIKNLMVEWLKNSLRPFE